MKIYLVRHGESVGNKHNVRQSPDVKLSKKGVRQAQKLAQCLAGRQFDMIYTSPMYRALQTATVIAQAVYQKLIIDQRLSEVAKPSETIGMSYDRLKNHPHTLGFLANLHDDFWRFSDDESFDQFRARVVDFLKYLAKKEVSSIICVTHSAVAILFLAIAAFGTNLKKQDFFQIYENTKIYNTQILEFELVNEKLLLIK